MSDEKMRKSGRAPGRFVTTKTIVETRSPISPVANTPIKRFDRKDAIERDLERYRAEARARLLRNGFDVPAYLMPKAPAAVDEDGDILELGADALRDVKSSVMSGPKPGPLAKVNNAPIAKSKTAPKTQATKPSRHVHVKAGVPQMLHQATATQSGGHVSSDVGDEYDHGAYQDYVDSLNGGRTLLDHMRSDGEQISGRVDELKTAEVTKSRIDLPDNSASWVSREGHYTPGATRSGRAKKQSRAKRSKDKSRKGQPVNWNKALSKFAAYMIAAVCVGYVLVLTLNEFTAILQN